MAASTSPNVPPSGQPDVKEPQPARSKKKATFDLVRGSATRNSISSKAAERLDAQQAAPERRSRRLGILADKETDEVPGTVLLLSKYSTRNIPLGLQHEGRGRSASRRSKSQDSTASRRSSHKEISTKKTPDGKVILDPQPDDSANDPLNWPSWRRDCALLSLGFYCMLGGGMTPILAAGFNNVAETYNTTYAKVALTTGLYMMGLGVGSVIFSPTAILFGKRPVYLISAIMFVLASIWCAAAPSYEQLVVARVFQGIAVAPVECLPSATIAEIFFLHERAFRIGIYTLLLLGGKNLVPLVSAAVIESLGWRWVFWIVAIIVGVSGVFLFFFVPETFWDRTPRPRGLTRRSESRLRRSLSRTSRAPRTPTMPQAKELSTSRSQRVDKSEKDAHDAADCHTTNTRNTFDGAGLQITDLPKPPYPTAAVTPSDDKHAHFAKDDPNLPHMHNLNSPFYSELKKRDSYMSMSEKENPATESSNRDFAPGGQSLPQIDTKVEHDVEAQPSALSSRPTLESRPSGLSYTTDLRHRPPKPYVSTLKPWNGRLRHTNWLHAAIRPFILFAYPSILWSTLVYSLSIGWLIVISESVSHIYKNRDSYNFTSLQVGLVYLSPFVGGVLGTAVAGRVSDIIVRFMARRNDGVYEPEYRLVMAIPIAITTGIGLMGFGWSADERDAWIVPTVFFGIVSFGCSLGSTTSITFCVDSYRQFAGEALVTLNFSKNIFHGLVWSLFFPDWLEADGAKDVFLAIGGIQIACLLTTIPMYLYGKRARMWTVRKDMMGRFG